MTRVLSYVEIDVDRCSLTHGTSPCRARLQGDGIDPAAVNLDGTTARLARGAGLTGAADGKQFTANVWLRREAGASGRILASVTTVGGGTGRSRLILNASNQVQLILSNSAGTTICDINSTTAIADDEDWHHVLVSVDLSDTAKRHLYLDGVSDLTVATYTNDTADLTMADWGIGGYPSGTNLFDGDIAELWADDSYIDLSVSGNRAKFRSAGGNPVSLGDDGSTPTGASPLVYFGGTSFDSWPTNKGTGGDFTTTGTLVEAEFATGTVKCFNSLGTCQDRANFTSVATTLRFCMPADYRPHDVDAWPNIAGIAFSPAILSLGKDLGTRSSLKVTFEDHPWADTGPLYDKYIADRDYDPWGQGSFWPKFRARNPYMRGRAMRLIQGTEDQAIGDMETRHFLIESFDGPDDRGRFTIIAKDALKMADGDRAQAPALSPGRLNASITSGDVSATLTPSGIGNSDYPASGYLNIGGKEIVSFTRSGDTLTITRAQFNTTAQAHSAGDRLQLCLHYSADDPADIIYDLLANYADVDPTYLPLTAWQDETAAYYRRVNTALIAEPTPVRTLLSELIEQDGLALWWDDVNQAVRLQVLRAISTTAELYDDDNIVAGSLRVREQPGKRISRVWTYFGQLNPLKSVEDTDNYRSSAITADLDSEADHGQPAIAKIFSRWIPFGGLTTAERVNDIQLGRYLTAPRHFSWAVYRWGSATPVMGEGVQIESHLLQDASGARETVPVQIVRIEPREDVFLVEAEEMRFVSLDDDDLTTRTVVIDANAYNVNLRTLHDALYPEPISGDTVVCIINAGVTVGSTSISVPAFDVGSWPAGVSVTLRINGRIQGKGGNGGRGGNSSGNSAASNGEDGEDGGTALYTRFAIDVEYGAAGEVFGGGGGGGGGEGGGNFWDNYSGGGGGGGAGTDPGTGGARGQTEGTAQNGANGTADAGGNGGFDSSYRIGADGGDPGQAGSNATVGGTPEGGYGGAAGTAIDGDSYVTVTAGTGDVRGPAIN